MLPSAAEREKDSIIRFFSTFALSVNWVGFFFVSVRTKTTCSKNTVSLHAKPALIFLLFLPGLRLVIIT